MSSRNNLRLALLVLLVAILVGLVSLLIFLVKQGHGLGVVAAVVTSWGCECLEKAFRKRKERLREAAIRETLGLTHDAPLEFRIDEKRQVHAEGSKGRLRMSVDDFKRCFPATASSYLADHGIGWRSALKPENIGAYLGFILPPKVRGECFDPYFEELKEDRLRAIEIAKSSFGRRFIEACFHCRLAWALATSLLCVVSEQARKLAPIIKLFR